MSAGFLTQAQIEELRGFPSISDDELLRYFTLTEADIAFLSPSAGRDAASRLGLAVQMCTLPWLGFVPADLSGVPAVALARLATALSVNPDLLASYGSRGQTRSDHLKLVAGRLGWAPLPAEGPLRQALESFLLDRAMEHDSPMLLLNLAFEFLAARKTIRPGAVVMIRMVGSARAAAVELTYELVEPLLTDRFETELDDLLVLNEGLGMSRLAWLGKPAVEATAGSVKRQMTKLEFLRAMGANQIDLGVLGGERRRFLAAVGRRSSNQALARRERRQRFPILLNAIVQLSVDRLDEVIGLFDQIVSARESRAKAKIDEALAQRARAGEDRQRLLDRILRVLADMSVSDEAVGGLLRDQIGREELQMARSDSWSDLPRDHGFLEVLEASYPYLRQFTGKILEIVDFQGGPGTADLMTALEVLKDLNRSGARNVPDCAPTGFIPIRYVGYLDRASEQGDQAVYRHYWELCVLLSLRDGLRSADVYVPGSRRYADPTTYLFTTEKWRPRQAEFCALVGKPAEAITALQQGKDELDAALEQLDRVLADTGPDDVGSVRLDPDGQLVIPPLSAEDAPAEARAVKEELSGLLPNVSIASVLIELDHRTDFLSSFVHASSGKPPQTAEAKRNILAVLLAGATNLGLSKMAEASSVPYDTLVWTQEWHVREETLRDANIKIVNHHHQVDLAALFGGGTMSSSDGQRFPVRGKTLTARAMNTYFADRGLSAYTHVSDQHSTYGTKVLVPTVREAHYVLDELLGNATDLPITHHATDTHGATLINFALFDLVGKTLTPRIRDLGKITLTRADTKKATAVRHKHVAPLLTSRLKEDLIVECWPELLRVAGSLKYGQTTASLIVGKWSAASRQNQIASALKEWGLLRRTIHAARYLSDPDYRRRIARQLNKGESLHALRRDLHYANHGSISRPQLHQQTEQAWCLTLLTNVVVTWTTEYYSLAVKSLRSSGRDVPNQVLTHVSPAQSSHINFFGIINLDVDAELANLDSQGLRPLRNDIHQSKSVGFGTITT